MSADTAARLRCDHLDDTKPSGQRGCLEQVVDGTYGERTPGLPEHVFLWTRHDAWREGRKLGWATGVHADGSRGGRLDYCPAHKPAQDGA